MSAAPELRPAPAATEARPPGRVLIVGARGLARALAVRFGRSEAHLALVFRADEDAANETRRLAEESGATVQLLRGDIGDDARALVERSLEQLGGLDAFAYTAFAPPAVGEIGKVDRAGFERALAVGLLGFHEALVAAAEPLAASGGSVVATSSLGAERYAAYYGALGPTKAALEGLVRYHAAELGPRGIRVNAVSPTVIADGWQRDGDPDPPGASTSFGKVFERLAARTALRRLPVYAEVAEVVHWLCSPSASAVTGQTIRVDCGYSILG